MLCEQKPKKMHEELTEEKGLPKIFFTLPAQELALGLQQAILEEKSLQGQDPLEAAQAMLDFYIDDTQDLLTPEEKMHLLAVKKELIDLFNQ